MLPLNFFFEAVLSAIFLTATVFTTKYQLRWKLFDNVRIVQQTLDTISGRHDEPVDIFQACLCLDLRMRHPDCWPIKYFGEKKLHHSKVPRELIFGKLRSFYLFFKVKDFQEKVERWLPNWKSNQIKFTKNFQKYTKFTRNKEKSLSIRIYTLKTNLNAQIKQI